MLNPVIRGLRLLNFGWIIRGFIEDDWKLIHFEDSEYWTTFQITDEKGRSLKVTIETVKTS